MKQCDQETENHVSARVRPWLRFGLRTLLVLIFVCCVGLTWMMSLLNEGERHAQIAAELSAEHCNVGMSHYRSVPSNSRKLERLEYRSSIWRESTIPFVLDWLGGARALRRIQRVTLSPSDKLPPKELPSVLEKIQTLHTLPTLITNDSKISEQQIAELLANIEVHSLSMKRVQLSQQELPWLNQPGLTWLCLAHTEFSNPAIHSLPPSLEYLDASDTQINDAGLEDFRRLTHLRKLILRRTPTSQAAIEDLRKKMPWCMIE